MTADTDNAVELIIRHGEDSVVPELINLLPSRTDQIDAAVKIFIKREEIDEVIFEILRQLFKKDDLAFRAFLRDIPYWNLPRYKSTGSFRNSNIVAGAISRRVLILTEILKGWKWFHTHGEEPELSPDAEECFRFVCEAYADFDYPDLPGDPFPERKEVSSFVIHVFGENLRDEIENLLRKHITGRLPGEYGGKPFSIEDNLEIWLQKDYLPEDMLQVLLHGYLNILGPKESLTRLAP